MIRNHIVIPAVLTLAVAFAGCGGSDTPPPTVEQPPGPPAEQVPNLRSPIAAIQDDQVIRVEDPDKAGFLDGRMSSMVELGATVTRVDLLWSLVATSKPADPTDPNDPAYDWTRYDDVVAAAKRGGIEVQFAVWSTPDWAVDPSVPKDSNDPPGWGNRRPADPEAFGQFGQAAAKRYSNQGVKMWEAWNEANINFYLRPQYEKQGDRWVAIGPKTYTAMLNSFRENVKGVDPQAKIGGGVMAPRGDKCGLSCPASGETAKQPNRMSPQDFLRGLDQEGLRPEMDAVADHPYPSADPSRPRSKYAVDLYNLPELFQVIDETYLQGKRVWATEYGWQTVESEVLKYTVSPEEQAFRIAQAFATLRANPRLEMGTYYFLQDNGQFNTGLRDVDGNVKPGAGAFAVPMYAMPTTVAKGAPVEVTGQVRPTGGPTEVTIEWKNGGDWKELQKVKTSRDGTFEVTLRPPESVSLRPKWAGNARNGKPVEWTGAEIPITVE